MCVARSQTVEDAEPNRWPDWTLIHEGTTLEYVREEVGVRRPYALTDFERRLVVRHSQASTRITCSLEWLRVE